ncbi:hypothetical protein Tco_1546698 [Tanacetum coccineum]
MAPLPPRDQRHLWLRYQVEGYTKEIIYDFKQRLETIFGRQVKRVHILDFEGLTPDMRQDLEERMRMVYTRDDGQEVFVNHAWRRLFGIRAPLVQDFILEFFITCRIRDEMGLDVAGTLCFQIGGARCSMTWRQFILALGLHTAEEMAEDGFGAYLLGSERLIPDKGDLSDYWVEISSGRDFLRGAPSYTYIRDSVQRHAEGRKSGARLSGCHFIGRLAHHFGLVSDDGLRGLSIVAHELPLIDMGMLVKLNICMDLGDDWAWVAPRPKRQQVPMTSAPVVAEDAPAIDEGDQDVPAPEDWRRRCRDCVEMSRAYVDLHSMGLSEGSHLQHSKDAPGRGLARPAPPQLNRTSSSQTHDPSYPYLLIKPGSKFSTIVHEYVTEPSRIFTPK